MLSFLRWAKNSIRRPPSPPLSFPVGGFEEGSCYRVLEEERFDEFKSGKYYPVRIGEIFASKYLVVGKLGFGVTSTVWLARDLCAHRHVALKVYARGGFDPEEFGIYQQDTTAELNQPSPRKLVNNVPVYASRRFEQPKLFGGVVLSDFSSAVRGDVKRDDDVQPNVYRSPEVMLKMEWSYPIDIWNVGVMIWDLFEGKHMFYGNDPVHHKYMTRAHLSELVAMLGPPPADLLKRGKRSQRYFTEDGQWKADIKIPLRTSLEESEQFLEGNNKEIFLDFMRGMLQWRPEGRKTAKQLLEHHWLSKSIE
ncbi:hypothetical protein FQN57_004708 [Myotisia sp. PD_48]|nr:hypothetical protein FQN57_004708 [Myotisia sp. PD_48]